MIMKKISLILAALAVTLMMVGPVWAQGQTQGKTQTKCPVLAGNVDKKVYTDYKGHRYYFCCKGCDEQFKKNPEKYIEKMKAEGITPEKTPAGK
jgi:YHS domain-containing protein